MNRVRDTFQRFRSGDLTWTDDIHPDIEWDVSAYPLPDVPDRGRGRDGLLGQVFATYFSGWLDYSPVSREAIDA